MWKVYNAGPRSGNELPLTFSCKVFLVVDNIESSEQVSGHFILETVKECMVGKFLCPCLTC